MRYDVNSKEIKEAINRFSMMQYDTDIIEVMFDKFKYGPMKIEFFQKEIKNENGRTDDHVLLNILDNGSLYVKMKINDFLIDIETRDFNLDINFEDEKNAILWINSEDKGILTIGLQEDQWKDKK